MADDSDRVPTGRLRRLARVAALGPRAGLALARDAVDRAAGAPDGERLGEVLYTTLGKLKGGSLKAGQLAAQVSDALPEAARVRLGRLFSAAPTLAWPDVVEVIVAELGAPPEVLFAEIDPEPFAAASLGQVHRARLDTGDIVAVKIQYPGVAEALEHDLQLLQGVMGTISAGGLILDIHAYFEALRDDTLAELDYRLEAAWLTRLAEATAPWPDLVVPRFHADLSAERVLTTSLLEGPTLHAMFEVEATDEDRRQLGLRVVRAVFGPLFGASIVNADAHPGNFVVLDDERLGLLDFGAATEVSPALVRGLSDLLHALVTPGSDAVAHLEAAGMQMRRIDRPVLLELTDLMAVPLRGVVDFSADATLEEIGRFKQRHPVSMLRFAADPGLLPVFRSMIGVYHALKHLRVQADLGAAVLALTERRSWTDAG